MLRCFCQRKWYEGTTSGTTSICHKAIQIIHKQAICKKVTNRLQLEIKPFSGFFNGGPEGIRTLGLRVANAEMFVYFSMVYPYGTTKGTTFFTIILCMKFKRKVTDHRAVTQSYGHSRDRESGKK